MITEAIEKVLSLGKTREFEHDENLYIDRANGRAVSRLKAPEQHAPDHLKTHTLDSIKGYLESNDIPYDPDALFLHVQDYDTVNLFGHLDPKNDNIRFNYLTALLEGGKFSFGHWIQLEDFIIALQSMFVPDEQIDALIDMLGNLANEQIVENKDDGFSQSIQIKTGIHTKSQVKIKNPLTLRPYRTFREVEQPASQVIFRLNNRNGMACSLHIADGGKWKLEAMHNIAEYLRKAVDIPVIA